MDRLATSTTRQSALTLNPRDTRRAIVHELRLVEGAIALVASGSVPRVTVGGLSFGAQLMPTVAARARRRQVHVHELWSPWSDTCQVEVRLDG